MGSAVGILWTVLSIRAKTKSSEHASGETYVAFGSPWALVSFGSWHRGHDLKF